jgi:DNA-binding protein HU-beta
MQCSFEEHLSYLKIIYGGIIMNKTELIAAVAEKSELSKKDAEKAVNAVVNTIVEALKADEKVSSSVSVPLKQKPVRHERATTRRPVPRSRLRQPRLQLSRQARL